MEKPGMLLDCAQYGLMEPPMPWQDANFGPVLASDWQNSDPSRSGSAQDWQGRLRAGYSEHDRDGRVDCYGLADSAHCTDSGNLSSKRPRSEIQGSETHTIENAGLQREMLRDFYMRNQMGMPDTISNGWAPPGSERISKEDPYFMMPLPVAQGGLPGNPSHAMAADSRSKMHSLGRGPSESCAQEAQIPRLMMRPAPASDSHATPDGVDSRQHQHQRSFSQGDTMAGAHYQHPLHRNQEQWSGGMGMRNFIADGWVPENQHLSAQMRYYLQQQNLSDMNDRGAHFIDRDYQN